MTVNEPSLFEIGGLNFDYSLGTQTVHALRDVDLVINEGDFICLAGPSGSGKSTLLKILGLIEPVKKGHVFFKGEDFGALNETAKNRIRKFQLGFIFQEFHLLPILNAEENVEYFLIRQRLKRDTRKERVRAALDAVGLDDHRLKRPREMSGGQRQRVAIARAIAKRPDVIIADEPTASLDQETGKTIMEIITELNRERGVSVIVASHDPMVLAMSDKVIRLRDGQIVDDTSPDSGVAASTVAGEGASACG